VKTSGNNPQEDIKHKYPEPNSSIIDSVTQLQRNKEADGESKKENVKPKVKAKGQRNKAKVILEDSAKETNSEDDDDSSLEILYLESPKASKTKAKGKKGSLNKVGKRAVSHRERLLKIDDDTLAFNEDIKDSAEYVSDSDTTSNYRKSSRKSISDACDEKVESIVESPDSGAAEVLSRSVHLNPDTGLFETLESEEENIVKEPPMKPKKNTKKRDVKNNRKATDSSKKNLKIDSKET
jgi:hypothetical protein